MDPPTGASSRRSVQGVISAGMFVAIMSGICSLALGQVLGEEAEMERLYLRAEEAIANEDPEGAAMNAGRAALMASQLAKSREGQAEAQMFRGASRLFRAQEYAYRALALFERAGGQPPASSGVCQSTQLAEQHIRHSLKLLAGDEVTVLNQHHRQQAQRFRSDAADWVLTINGLNEDFECR